LLLDHGADINIKGEWDNTPLHLASENEDNEIMERTWMSEIPETEPPLHMALGSANPERIVQTLLKHKVDANAAGIEGRTPLHMA
jgi:ankyrin repeat protein